MEWRLRVAEALMAPGALPAPAGLLLGAVDAAAGVVAVLGAVPAPSDASASALNDIAKRVAELVPEGVGVLGAYGMSAAGCGAVPFEAGAAAGAAPPTVSAAVDAAAAGGAPSFTLGGKTVAAPEAAPPAAPGGGLCPQGLVALRAHADALLRVVAPKCGAPTAADTARALDELERQFAPDGLAFATDPRPGAPRALLTAAVSDTALEDALAAAGPAAVDASDPCVSLVPLQCSSGSGSGGSGGGNNLPAAPILRFEPGGGSTTEVLISLDALALLPARAPAAAAAAALGAALRRQLGVVRRMLTEQKAAGGGPQLDFGAAGVAPVRAHHFLPPGWALPVTVCYPRLVADADAAERALLPARQALHALLGLPGDVPVLRAAGALAWGGGGSGDAGGNAGGGDEPKVARLRDVHIGLPAPPVGAGATVTLLRGSYEYCHYMQGRTNDAGWGCAYRSLQTIVSWFRLQRYTAKPVPTHREVQATLARLGDKDASFVGSSQWIGAIELGYVLDDYLGVTSKIMTVSRGADIPSRARELAAHFATHGTPVMIGGGVLAYTLLGVAFDELTGDAAFLILDPHYTGGEDLKKVQAGAWVGWKVLGDAAAAGGPLFVEDAFYNFLLPQRPATV